MTLIDSLVWSLRHCRKRLFESLLIILAVGLGVAVIVAILSLFISIQSQLNYSGNDQYMRTFRIYSAANTSFSSGREAPLTVTQERPTEQLRLNLSDLQDIQESLPPNMHVFVDSTYHEPTSLLVIPENEDPANDHSVRYESFSDDGTMITHSPWETYESIQLTSTTPNYFLFHELELAAGNWFIDEDLETNNPVVILSDRLATKLYGNINPIGQTLPIESFNNRIDYEVIGVLTPAVEEENQFYGFYQDEQGYIPYTASPHSVRNSQYGEPPTINSFTIGVDPGTDLNAAVSTIQAEIEQRFGELAIINSTYQSLQSIDDQQQSIFILIGVFASLGLVIAVINILNLMLARVLKRTKTVGLSMALGASKKSVFFQFLIEALVLGVVGALLGIVLALGVIELLANITYANISIGLSGIGIGCGLGLLVSLLFGVYPAYQGSQVDPVEALRND